MSVLAIPQANKFPRRVNAMVTPTEVANVAVYLDGDTWTAASWTDLSGLGHHCLQATGSKQGTQLAAAQNGHAAVRLDGVDDFYTAAYVQNGPTTTFFVYRQNSFNASGAHDIIYDGGTGTGTTFVICSNTVNQKFRINAALTYDTQVANAVFAYTTVVFDTIGYANVNGQLIGTGSFAGNPGGFTVGALTDGTRSTQLDVLMALQYGRRLSLYEIARIEAYIKARYAL